MKKIFTLIFCTITLFLSKNEIYGQSCSDTICLGQSISKVTVGSFTTVPLVTFMVAVDTLGNVVAITGLTTTMDTTLTYMPTYTCSPLINNPVLRIDTIFAINWDTTGLSIGINGLGMFGIDSNLQQVRDSIIAGRCIDITANPCVLVVVDIPEIGTIVDTLCYGQVGFISSQIIGDTSVSCHNIDVPDSSQIFYNDNWTPVTMADTIMMTLTDSFYVIT